MSAVVDVSPSVASSRPSPGRPLLLLTLAVSLLVGGLASAFVTGALPNAFAEPRSVLVRDLLDPARIAVLVVGLALLGVLGAGLALLRPADRRVRLAASVLALVEVLAFGVALQSTTTIALAGYLVALALPVGLVWLAVQALRRYPRLRWLVVVLVAAVLTWGLTTQALRPEHLSSLGHELVAGFGRASGRLLLAVLLGCVTACWALVAVAALRHSGAAARTGGWALRHRRGLTLLAAAGPLPYAVVRSSWLTPWPLLSPADEALTPEIRLWGLLLGGGALLGSVLTVGLIRPWGVTFPRWMPWCAGRTVPPAAAIVPGGVVAGILCASAAPMLQLMLFPEPGEVFGGTSLLGQIEAVVIFPFWIWGPALALAVWGYARARQTGAPALEDQRG